LPPREQASPFYNRRVPRQKQSVVQPRGGCGYSRPHMGTLATLELEDRTAQVRAQLAAAARHGRLVYSNSLGAEAMVLTDIIATAFPQLDIFSIDTGRLHEETYTVLEKLQHRYGNRIRVVAPDAAALERLVARQGVNGFYASIDNRAECCRVRKVEPFRRAVA